MNKYNQAINECLQVIGEQTIEGDLSIEGIYEAEQADALIESTKEEILSEGWSFNTDTDWTLSPDTDNYITVPPSALRVDPTDADTNYIRKSGRLYDKDNRTYKITSAVDCDIVWNIDFDEIPVIMQKYIVLKSARILYQRLVGDTNMLSVLMEDEREARLRINIHEDDVNDYNIFDDTSVSRAINRNANPTGLRG